MYHKAQRWKTRPSEFLDIPEPYDAYCFDEAVDTWGQYVEGELDKITDKNSKRRDIKRRNRLGQLLDLDPSVRFRSFKEAGKGP